MLVIYRGFIHTFTLSRNMRVFKPISVDEVVKLTVCDMDTLDGSKKTESEDFDPF